MKWIVRLAAGCAIALLLFAVFFRHEYVPRFATLVVLIVVGVGIFERVDMSWLFGGDDDNDDGPVRPA